MQQQSNTGLDKQILSALERLSEAFRVLLWEQSKATGLSPIQIQFLIFISTHRPEQSTISYLAVEFNLTKATVSDSVKVLLAKGLLVKVSNNADSRSFSLRPTPVGMEVVNTVSAFTWALKDSLVPFSDQEKQSFYKVLHGMIKGLNQRGIISIQRNCSSCSFYSIEDGSHYCSLIQSKLQVQELKTDCADHELKE